MIAVAASFRTELRSITPSSGVRIVRTPMGDRAPERLETLFATTTPSVLLSTGFCGGLRDEHRTGDLVLAGVIRHRGEEIIVSPDLLRRAKDALGRSGLDVEIGPSESIDRVADADFKRRLADSGAVSVEMEAGALARWASHRGVPFLSLRAVLDLRDEDLPPMAKGAWIGQLLGHPIRILRLGDRAREAGRSLGHAVDSVISAFQEAS